MSAFTDLLKDLLVRLTKKFPMDRDLAYSRSQIELGLSMSPTTTINAFVDNVLPYKEKIKNRQESFFLNMAQTDESVQYLNIGDKWNLLSNEDKDFLWKTVFKLLNLGIKLRAC